MPGKNEQGERAAMPPDAVDSPSESQGATWEGREVLVEVGAVAHGGHCVARVEGRVVFVRHALPGERVRARVTEDTGGSYCRADAVEVVDASPHRVAAPCPVAAPGGCGGCDWQHATWAYQRHLKAAVVTEQLRRLAGVDHDVEVEPLPGGPLRSRTRLRLVAGTDGRPGFREHRRHRVVPVADCLVAPSGALADVLGRRWRPGARIDLTVDGDGRTHVGEGVAARASGGRSARPPAGGRAREYAAGREWRLDAHGFWQGHPAAADTYAGVVADWARVPRDGVAWDLYAGVGLFAAVLADQVGPRGTVVAVESGRRAVTDGRANLADLPQVRWRGAQVERVVDTLRPAPDVVVLDPPRKGAGRAVVASVAAAAPARVVYVACDPAALARDVATFGSHGYRLAALRAFDAFPMTHHVECLALLDAA